MSNKHFKYDETALDADRVTVDFGKITGTTDGSDAVEFVELSHPKLREFIKESIAIKTIVEDLDEKGEPKKNETGEPLMKSRPVEEIAEESFGHLCKWLAEATRGKRKAAYFEKLDMTATMVASLADMLLKINHVEEVLAARGNLLMLPQTMTLFAAANEEPSESPGPTLHPA